MCFLCGAGCRRGLQPNGQRRRRRAVEGRVPGGAGVDPRARSLNGISHRPGHRTHCHLIGIQAAAAALTSLAGDAGEDQLPALRSIDPAAVAVEEREPALRSSSSGRSIGEGAQGPSGPSPPQPCTNAARRPETARSRDEAAGVAHLDRGRRAGRRGGGGRRVPAGADLGGERADGQHAPPAVVRDVRAVGLAVLAAASQKGTHAALSELRGAV